MLFAVAWPPAQGFASPPDLASLFEKYRARGTLLVVSEKDDRTWVHDEDRSRRRFIPASTFKIPNTLIVWEKGLVSSPDQIFRWDGRKRRVNAWNRDLSFREAFKVSAVPVFKELARRVGLRDMRLALQRIGYGNALVGRHVDTFWLAGPLRLSAAEQIGFLLSVVDGTVAYGRKHVSTLKAVMIDGSGPGWVLRGKTGWTTAPDPGIGWYVGWLETGDNRLFFALNMDMTEKQHRVARRALVVDALRQLTALPIQ